MNVDVRGRYLGKCPVDLSGSVPSRKQHYKSSTGFSSELATNVASESSLPMEVKGDAFSSGTQSDSESESDGRASGRFEIRRPLVGGPLGTSRTRTFRDRSFTSPSLYAHASSSSRTDTSTSDAARPHSSAIAQSVSSVHTTIGGATRASAQLQADPPEQKLRKPINPRDLQEASRALVRHVLRVECLEASPHALHVCSIASCGPHVLIILVTSIKRYYKRLEQLRNIILIVQIYHCLLYATNSRKIGSALLLLDFRRASSSPSSDH